MYFVSVILVLSQWNFYCYLSSIYSVIPFVYFKRNLHCKSLVDLQCNFSGLYTFFASFITSGISVFLVELLCFFSGFYSVIISGIVSVFLALCM